MSKRRDLMRWALCDGGYSVVCELAVDHIESSLPMAFLAFTSHCMSSARSDIGGRQTCKRFTNISSDIKCDHTISWLLNFVSGCELDRPSIRCPCAFCH